MSRWTEKFKSHPFQKTWEELKAIVETSKVDDVTITTSVMELSRLGKAVAYINALIDGIDPELVPITMWDSFNSQASACKDQMNAFRSNRNVAHIVEANNHVDNLLSYVRPYMATKGAIGKALKDAAIEYSETVEKIIVDISKSSEIISENARTDSISIKTLLDSSKTFHAGIEEAHIVVVGDEETMGMQKEIAEIHTNAEKNTMK